MKGRLGIMNNTRSIGLPLIIAMILSLFVTMPASAALPEFMKGAAKLGPNEHFRFTGASEGAPEILKIGIACKASTSSGNTNGPEKLEKVVIIFTGCLRSTENCETVGKGAGIIETTPLKGTLVYLNKAPRPPLVGIQFEPENGGTVMTVECKILGLPGLNQVISGAVIGEVKPVNGGELENWENIFEPEIVGGVIKQKWEKAEGGPMKVLSTACLGEKYPVLKDKEKMTWEAIKGVMTKIEIKG
jgi:hypothetical protein